MLRTPAPLIGALGVIRSMPRFLLIGTVIVLAGCGLFEQPYRELSRYDQSLYAGRWVPDIFPHDIVKIREQHDVDTNKTWLRFRLTNIAYDPKQHNYIEVSRPERSTIKLTSPARPIWRTEWWPKDIDQSNDIYTRSGNAETSYMMITPNREVYWWRIQTG